MRSIAFLFALVSCGGVADDDASMGAGGASTAGHGGDIAMAGGVNIGGRPMNTTKDCICLPSCSMTAIEAEELLCTFANGSLIVRSTFDGCSDVRFSEIDWNRAETFVVKNGHVAGCTSTSETGSSQSGSADVSSACAAQTVHQCAPCPEMADPFLWENYATPVCQD